MSKFDKKPEAVKIKELTNAMEIIAYEKIKFYRKLIKESNNQKVINLAHIEMNQAKEDFDFYQNLNVPF